MRPVVGLAGILLLSGCVDLATDREQQFADYSLIADDISKASSFVLYEGLPSDFSFTEEHKSEKASKRTVEFQKNLFYEKPITVRPPDIERLKEIFADRSTFVRYGGPKACGGFHADFALEWNTPSGLLRTLICFTCHEMASEKNGEKVLCDLSNQGYANLRKVLDKYKVNVPTVTFEGLMSYRSSLSAAQSASTYIGLPRGVKPSVETKQLHGYDFYKNSAALPATAKKSLEEFFAKSGMITAHEPKKCMFHPDFAIEWAADDMLHHWLICLGCSEVKFLTEGVEEVVYYDLTPQGAKLLRNLFSTPSQDFGPLVE
jgi:hypothetical protein